MIADGIAGAIKLLHYWGFADRAKQGSGHLSTLVEATFCRKERSAVPIGRDQLVDDYLLRRPCRQLRDVGRNPPRLIFREQLC